MTWAGRIRTAGRRARAARGCAMLLLAALLGGCGLDRGLAVRADAVVEA